MLHFQKLHFQSEPTSAFSTSNCNKANQLNVIIKQIAKILIITQLKEILKNSNMCWWSGSPDYIVLRPRPPAQVRNRNRLKSVSKFSPLLRI